MKARQQNSTSYPITFLMVLSSDHISPATGKTPTVTISKNGGAFGSPSGSVSEIGSGWYALAGNATDRNTLGDLCIHATATGCDPEDDRYAIVSSDPFGANLGLTNLDAAVSSRSTYAGGAVASVTAGVTVTTNNDKTGYTVSTVSDKTGYSLSAAGIQAIWDALTSALTTVGSIGKRLADYIDAAISSRSTYAGGAVASVTGAVGSVTGAVGSVTAAVNINSNSDVTAIKSKTDNLPASPAAVGSAMTLTAAYDAAKTAAQAGNQMDLVNAPNATAITAIKTAMQAAGTHLALIKAVTDVFVFTGSYVNAQVKAQDNIDFGATQKASITSAVPTAAAIKAAIEAGGSYLALIKVITDELGTALELDGAVYRFTVNALEMAPSGSGSSPSVIADAVWDEVLSGHLTAGTTGAKLNSGGGGSGSGAIAWTYTLTEQGTGYPIADADIWVTTDIGGGNVIASGKTNQYGIVVFYLDAGTVYVWCQKSGYNFNNPDTEVVS